MAAKKPLKKSGTGTGKIDLKANNASYATKDKKGGIQYYSRNPVQPKTDPLLTRGNQMIEQTKKQGSKTFKGSSYDTGIEPTVITDTTIRDKVIPEINSKINRYAETGQYYDANGNKFNANGSVADDNTQTDSTDPRQKKIDDLNASASDDDATINNTLDNLMKQTDRDTASQISAIKNQYEVRKSALSEINRRNEMATDTALLLGGSSRYSTSSNDISGAQRTAGVMALAQLDAQEQSAIAEAKNAKSEKNYKIASLKLQRVEDLRKEKIAQATKLAEELAEENNTMRENMIKQSRESAIADLFMQGITEPAEVLQYLKDTGSDINLKEIKDTLDIINPDANLKGLSSDYQTYKAMQKAGEIKKDWTYFDYKTALGNASRAPKGSDYNSDGGFDFQKAKIKNVKAQAKAMFPGDFGSRVILELTDEELRDFLNWYQNESGGGEMFFDEENSLDKYSPNDLSQYGAPGGQFKGGLDPEQALIEWSDRMGVGDEKNDAFEQKLSKLFD